MKAHILIIADGRSPTALSWINNIQSLGYDVSLVSTFPSNPPQGIKHFHILPIAFSRFTGRSGSAKEQSSTGRLQSLIGRFTTLFQKLRYHLGPLSLPRYAGLYQHILHNIQPDLVHALRIPFEGMLGSYTPKGIPFLTATWGNDLTLHASGSWIMGQFTRRCLKRADGLTSDTNRDIHLAHSWGLRPAAPTLVVPGSGGLDLNKIQRIITFNHRKYGIQKTGTWVVNPRGLRPGSVHQETFFSAIHKVIEKRPDTIVICPGLAGNHQVKAWVKKLGIEKQTFLLPKLPQSELWALFKDSAVFVSPSSHDGTPNTLLESMAVGCFPVVGDIESLREWIEDGKNGLLVNPRDPDELSDVILTALERHDLREKAAGLNLVTIKNRAALSTTRPIIDNFYAQFFS
jgi:glycosyltransferase involved in cell wall biosynthesis